jgi:hypothetical protein
MCSQLGSWSRYCRSCSRCTPDEIFSACPSENQQLGSLKVKSKQNITSAPILAKKSSQIKDIGSKDIIDSLQTFKAAGANLLDWIAKYWAHCQDMPVISTVHHNYLKDALPSHAPQNSEPWSMILKDLDDKIIPGNLDIT